MKFCTCCMSEIDTKDGENLCRDCENLKARGKKPRGRKASRRMMESALRDLGMTKVRGALGGTYWE